MVWAVGIGEQRGRVEGESSKLVEGWSPSAVIKCGYVMVMFEVRFGRRVL